MTFLKCINGHFSTYLYIFVRKTHGGLANTDFALALSNSVIKRL